MKKLLKAIKVFCLSMIALIAIIGTMAYIDGNKTYSKEEALSIAKDFATFGQSAGQDCTSSNQTKGVKFICRYMAPSTEESLANLGKTLDTKRASGEMSDAEYNAVYNDIVNMVASCFGNKDFNKIHIKQCIDEGYGLKKSIAQQKAEEAARQKANVREQASAMLDRVQNVMAENGGMCMQYAQRMSSLRNVYGDNSSEVNGLLRQAASSDCF